MFFGDFHAEIKSTMETFGMDIEPTLGKFMASKMEENEAVDLAIEASQEKAGIKENEDMYDVVDKASGEMIDDDLPKRMALALAAKKKGWVTKKSQKKAGIKENKALNMTASAETLRKIIFKLLDDGQIQPETADDVLNAISNSPSNNVYEAEEEDEEVDIDIDVEDEVSVDVEEPAEPAGLSSDEQEIQDNLKMAYDNAVAIGDQKLADQIGNSITFFTRTHVVER